jgi:drug/metabolite transporter (DMT)-like permease
MQVPSRLPAMEDRAADPTVPVFLRNQSSQWPPEVRNTVQRHENVLDDPASSGFVGLLTRRIWNSAWTLLVLANVLWASNIIVGRAILGDVPAIALSFWRWTGAFAVAFWFAWPHLKTDWPVLLRQWKIMLALAATGIALFNTVAYIGLSGTTALNVLLMQSSLPLVVSIWAFVLFKEWPSGWQLNAIVISLAGVAFVAAHGSLDALLGLRFYRSDVWVMASVIILGSYMVLLRLRPDVHPLSFMQAAMGLGVLMVAPLYLRELNLGMRITGHWQNFAGIAYMAVFPSFISYLFFNRGVQLIGATRAGQSTHLIPITGSIMAVMFLAESLHVYHFVGIVLIGAGIGLAQLKAPAL